MKGSSARPSGLRFARRVRHQALLLGLTASLVAGAFYFLETLTEIEGVTVDFMMRLRGAASGDPRVVVVEIDEPSLDRYGRWPWRRDRIAQLVEGIAGAGARTLALDIVFAEPSRQDEVVDLSAEDDALAEAIERAGNVILGYFFRRRDVQGAETETEPTDLPVLEARGDFGRSLIPRRPAVEPNLPIFARAAAGQGFYDQRPEAGVHRHYDLVAEFQGFHRPALALAAAAHFEDASPTIHFEGSIPEIRLGSHHVVTDERGQLWINYRGPGESFEHVSAVDVFEGTAPDRLSDRLVFVGFTEPGLGEIFTSPWRTEMAGVYVHAYVADNLLNDRYLRDTGVEALGSLLATLLLGPLVSLLVVLTPGRPGGALAAVVLVVLWPALAYLAFLWGDRHLLVTVPFFAGSLALVGQVAWEGRSRQVQRTFEQFVSRDVVEEMIHHPEQVRLGGESRELTVLFCDIRGFTSLSEGREPREVVEILNRFFTPMTSVVIDHGGTLDKYMGDALMAFFGALGRPSGHAPRACRAALAMCEELERLREEAARGDDPLPEGFGVGIGLNTGVMTVGNMGSEQIFDYTVIGDPVNLGSRVEGLTRVYGVEIVVTDFTREAASEDSEFVFRELDLVRVKGRTEPVRVYELMESRPEHVSLVKRFEVGLALYRQRRFGEASRVFAEILKDRPDDGPAREFLKRSRGFEQEPPAEGWDGVLERTTK